MKDLKHKFIISKLDRFNYPMLKSRLIDLYLQTFTKGEYAQYIDIQTAGDTLDYLIENGYGNIVMHDEQPIAFALATALLYDKEFPIEEIKNIKPESTIYIAEVLVHIDFRRKGLACALIESLLDRDNYTGATIRVWDKNRPAIELYKKLGFNKIAEISQSKMSSPEVEFQMNKIYMYKKLTA